MSDQKPAETTSETKDKETEGDVSTQVAGGDGIKRTK